MTSEIALRGEFLPKMVWQQIEEVSARLIKSQALPSTITNGAQLTMVLLAGYEAGMKPMESLNAYYIVNGRLTIYGDAVIRQLKRAEYKVKWVDSDETKATVKLIAPDGDEHEETYTMKDATTANLAGKAVWKMYPKDQLRWKCIARAVRFFCPEVLGGVQYFKEEAEDFVEAQVVDVPSETGELINAEQEKEIIQLILSSGGTIEEANGWCMGQFQSYIADLTKEQANKVLEVFRKKVELKGMMAKKIVDSEAIPDEVITDKACSTEDINEERTEEVLPIIQADLEITDEDIAPLVKK